MQDSKPIRYETCLKYLHSRIYIDIIFTFKFQHITAKNFHSENTKLEPIYYDANRNKISPKTAYNTYIH